VSAPRLALAMVDNASDHANTEIAQAIDGLPVSVIQLLETMSHVSPPASRFHCVGILSAVPSRFASADLRDGGRVGTAGARHPVAKVA